MAFTDQGRKKFAASCATFISKFGFDGVDIDWEYPCGGGMDPTKGRPEDRQTFTLLLAELRSQLDAQGKSDHKEFLLTIAAPGLPRDFAGTDLAKIHPHLDWINLMSYDLAGIWSKVTGFNAPLYSSGDASDEKENVDASVQAYLAAGVPKDKLVVGVPFYGKAWGGVKDVDHGLHQPPEGKPPRPPGGGEWTWRYLSDKYIDKVSPRFWNEKAKVPWSYDAKTGIFVTYDDPESIRLKAQYVREHDLGGVMIWELNQDDPQLSMLKAVNAGLTRAGP
jgi:chitinase